LPGSALISVCFSPIKRPLGGSGSRHTPGPLTLMAALTATSASGRRRVSFADSFGLELTAVRVYGQEETREGKQVTMDQSLRLNSHVMLVDGIGDGEDARSLEALEPEPEDPLTARGLVRVLNMTYDKYVSVRRSLDSWQTYSDVRSRYEPKEHNDYSDCFSFLLTVPRGIARPGLRLEFAVRYCTPFAEFWANNGGQNFVFAGHEMKMFITALGPYWP
uniref:CBM21 domain-containing protein n=1 Tax=Eptatretus burgeri TaxID=7764 RepID=A0A8C4NFF0_EPTBU